MKKSGKKPVKRDVVTTVSLQCLQVVGEFRAALEGLSLVEGLYNLEPSPSHAIRVVSAWKRLVRARQVMTGVDLKGLG